MTLYVTYWVPIRPEIAVPLVLLCTMALPLILHTLTKQIVDKPRYYRARHATQPASVKIIRPRDKALL